MVGRVKPDDWESEEGIFLDSETQAAVKADTNTAIMAGPGAGKTELLAQRAAYLLQTDTCHQPKRILAISFKRDAAKNLKARVEKRVGTSFGGRFESYTFDAFAKNLLDRFGAALPNWCMPTRDYQIFFPNWQYWMEFSDGIVRPDHFREETINGQVLNVGHAFWGNRIEGLPLEEPIPSQLIGHAWLQWWDHHVKSERSRLTFPMIFSLALTILKHNPLILQAIRKTYSHVFIDEFQDTTSPQYQLVKLLFRDSASIITSVGDNKQLIMTFAGAHSDRIEEFKTDFQAAVTTLAINFRSNRRIVDIVNSMAILIEPTAIRTISAKGALPLPPQTDGILHFSDSMSQARYLAKLIAGEVNGEQSLVKQHDFMLLVRQRPDLVEDDLVGAFAELGLKLRNEARTIHTISIQDMMSEPLADLVIGILQMASNDREDNPFMKVTNLIGRAFGIDDDRAENVYRIEKSLRKTVSIVSALIEPDSSLGADFNFDALISEIVETLGEEKIRRLSSSYEDGGRYLKIKRAISSYLAECAQNAGNWKAVTNSFVGRDQVRLMTVHKSKGLEAHTVIFLNLQDGSFHPRADMYEERLTFFVAISRARERLFVTTTNSAQNRVSLLFEMLAAAEMPVLHPL